jgi:hypothetical protein
VKLVSLRGKDDHYKLPGELNFSFHWLNIPSTLYNIKNKTLWNQERYQNLKKMTHTNNKNMTQNTDFTKELYNTLQWEMQHCKQSTYKLLCTPVL